MSAIDSIFEDLKIELDNNQANLQKELAEIQSNLQKKLANIEAESTVRMNEIDKEYKKGIAELGSRMDEIDKEYKKGIAESDARTDELDEEYKKGMADINARIAKLQSEADPADVGRVKAIEARVNAMTLDEINAIIAESEKKAKQSELMLTCECGSKLQMANKKRYFTTKKHIDYVQSSKNRHQQ